ncbi:MAG: signal peptidase I [Treponemataceae bacterium]|nr:signal peptidase I [Treponemataceae bacterium]
MNKTKKQISLPLIFLITLTIAFLIKLFVLDIVLVSGTSMMPNIKDGEIIFINKLAYGIVQPFSSSFLVQWDTPKENDVVIYLYNDKMVVKRCIATEFTPLEFYQDSEYNMEVNNKNIPLKEEQFQRIKNSYFVPEGMILAIGDNYAESVDSRNYGFVSVKNIIGKVLCK